MYISSLRRNKYAFFFSLIAMVGITVGASSCGKGGKSGLLGNTRECSKENTSTATTTTTAAMPAGAAYQTLTSVLTVADIRTTTSGPVEVIFNENTEFFTVADEATLAVIRTALSTGAPLNVTFDPWQGVITNVAAVKTQDPSALATRSTITSGGTAKKVDLSTTTNSQLDNPSEMGILNTTDPGLNNVIPDFATAQLMFDYICRQCCYLPGPYAIDYCIPFQYCIDGCYARAHKMCWIINNRYKYGTKKIFSFANAGSDKLCVKGQKWGGCCIRWWYHVAPLVTIQTTTGPKAYVFDPAMFNQPVLLSTWLHAQENPACAGSWTPNVTMINVQPTASYAPSGSSGMTFSTDASYSATNTTLNNYRYLVTCP